MLRNLFFGIEKYIVVTHLLFIIGGRIHFVSLLWQ